MVNKKIRKAQCLTRSDRKNINLRQVIFLTAILIFFLPQPHAFSKEIKKERAEIKELSLADCVFLTLRNNKNIETAYLDRVVQKFDLKVAKDEFVPDLSVTPSIKYTNTGDLDDRTYTFKHEIGLTVTEKVPTGAEFVFSWAHATENENDSTDSTYSMSWNISARQPLLKGGGIDVNTVSIRTAHISEQINILNLKSIIIDTITSAINSYRAFVQARKALEITKNSLKRARELMEVNKALIEAGRMAKVEIVQTQADIASKEFGLTQAENAADAARLSLLKILDIDMYTKIIPVEKIVPDIKQPDLYKCTDIAFKNRSDYGQALLNMKITEMDLIVAKNNSLWDLSLEGGYSGSGMDETKRNWAFKEAQQIALAEWNLGLSLNIPFGDLTREQGVLRAKTNLKKAEINLKKLKDNIKNEVNDAVRDVQMKLRQVELARQARKLSKKKLVIEKEKLKAGRSSNFQLVSFQNDLISAQNNELNAAINYLNALTSLDKTLGTTLDTWKINIKKD